MLDNHKEFMYYIFIKEERMPVLNVHSTKVNFDTILEKVQNTYEPVMISGEKYSAVLLSEEAWRSIEETLYLTSIPGMKESIIAGMQEKIENCSSVIEW
jgi:PHD/YefM family antitoxin component YafN of YafNO toxin-antitoxin module